MLKKSSKFSYFHRFQTLWNDWNFIVHHIWNRRKTDRQTNRKMTCCIAYLQSKQEEKYKKEYKAHPTHIHTLAEREIEWKRAREREREILSPKTVVIQSILTAENLIILAGYFSNIQRERDTNWNDNLNSEIVSVFSPLLAKSLISFWSVLLTGQKLFYLHSINDIEYFG